MAGAPRRGRRPTARLTAARLRPGPAPAGIGAGFTLVEMLITLAVAGVLGAAILSLVLGQNRFYGQSDDTIYAQQSLRAAMDLMASELRMGSPGDLMAAEPDSVTLRFDLERAVVCAVTAGDQASIYVYDKVENANLPSGFRGGAYSGPYEAPWHYASTEPWTPTVDATGAVPKLDCTSRGAPDTGADADYRRVSGWGTAFGGVPERGSLVRFYGKLTYRFDESSFTDGMAVFRNGQELVSPFEDGPNFLYVMADGSVQNAVSPVDFSDVRTIRIDVTARGDGANRYDVQRSISYDVALRN